VSLGVEIIVVALVVAAAIGVAVVAYLAGRGRGAEVLERRRLDRALSTKVEAVMSRPATVARETMSVGEAASTMLRLGYGCLPVLDDQGRLTGIVTASDLTGTATPLSMIVRGSTIGSEVRQEGVDAAYAAASSKQVREVMNRRVVTTTSGEEASDAALKMLQAKVHHLPVVEGDAVVGVVSRQDLLSLLAQREQGAEPT
jgi:CBS domain-containing protein